MTGATAGRLLEERPAVSYRRRPASQPDFNPPFGLTAVTAARAVGYRLRARTCARATCPTTASAAGGPAGGTYPARRYADRRRRGRGGRRFGRGGRGGRRFGRGGRGGGRFGRGGRGGGRFGRGGRGRGRFGRRSGALPARTQTVVVPPEVGCSRFRAEVQCLRVFGVARRPVADGHLLPTTMTTMMPTMMLTMMLTIVIPTTMLPIGECLRRDQRTKGGAS
jgi:hypothetical protein